MAKKAAKGRVIIHLECTTCRESGKPGVSRYSTTKNKRTTPHRLEFMKYCRYERKHTLHKEIK
ncbi:MAG: 50S ribosomal protein L33 [Myxococcota bacterium]|jgi:large subunit ribosomal protein L33|nr:50S ribosomal protein L33 [Myxococcota bacterium]